MTGWQSRAVPGYLPPRAFFACLARARVPDHDRDPAARRSSTTCRSPTSSTTSSATCRCTPIRSSPTSCRRTGRGALAARDEEKLERLARLFWFTVEFGLIRESGELKLYGSRPDLVARRGAPRARGARRRAAPLRPRARLRHALRDRPLPADALRARELRAAPRRDARVVRPQVTDRRGTRRSVGRSEALPSEAGWSGPWKGPGPGPVSPASRARARIAWYT